MTVELSITLVSLAQDVLERMLEPTRKRPRAMEEAAALEAETHIVPAQPQRARERVLGEHEIQAMLDEADKTEVRELVVHMLPRGVGLLVPYAHPSRSARAGASPGTSVDIGSP